MVKKGYKQTEIGVIPEDWEVKELKEVCKPSSNKVNPLAISENYKCIELEHIEQNTGILLGYTNSKNTKSQKTLFNKNDVLFGKLRPYLRKYYFAQFKGLCSTEIWVLNALANIENKWLFYIIQTDNIIDVANQSTGTKMPRAEWNIVGDFKIPIPPKPEQEKIAKVLSDTDELIKNLKELIAKKEDIKKATMQQLLTGKKRLKGFSGEWVEKKLGEVARIKKGIQYNKEFLSKIGKYPVINGGIEPSGFTDKFNCNENTITISEGGNSCGYVDYIKTKFWLGGHCYSLLTLKQNKIFLYYLIKFNEKKIMNLRVGSGLPNIQISSLEEFAIKIPTDITEQKAIAKILSVMDEEIEALKEKLEKTEAIKQGMMQDLLSGRIRLI